MYLSPFLLWSIDANLDGVVDAGDLGVLAVHWQQQTGANWFDADFNYDEKVDIYDLWILDNYYP